MKLEFDSKNTFYKKPFGAVAEDTVIAFRAEIISEDGGLPGAIAENLRVGLSIREDGKAPVWVEGQIVDIEGDDTRHICRLSWKAPGPGLFFYHFQAWHFDLPAAKTEECQLTVYRRGFEAPEWLAGGLMYQIFPDRFAKSAAYEAPPQSKDYRLHSVWGEEPDSGPDENGIVWNNDFFGGNLRGIMEKLSYLADLGVTVIYLNPIFRAFSNHRYDTANYMEIDPMLGTEQDFSDLCGAALERGIRIVIDGVFNHTGSHSVYFNKDGAFDSLGACQSRDSVYYPWYHFQEYPDRYDSWWGIDTLPAVNEMDESYREYIMGGEDSVIRHWLRLGASGVRLDVADELPDAFIEELREAVKSVRPDGAVIGEVWEDASNKIAYGERRRYFQGKQLDSVMNYPLKDWTIALLNDHRDGRLFQEQVTTLMEHYPRTCARSLMNILGTHDTERILTVFRGRSATYEETRQKLFMALMIWAFMPGIPCIYYGDELGMEGGRDPFNRRCFQPEQGKKDIESFYRRLLHFRKSIDGLGDMNYEPGPSGEGYFSFRRSGRQGAVFVYLNLSEKTKRLEDRLPDDVTAVDLVNCGGISFDGDKGLLIGPGSGIAVLLADKRM